jgi:hypothetical protein
MPALPIGSVIKAPLPEIRADLPAVAHDGLIYVFGGYHDSWTLGQAEVFEYDPVADTWTQKTSMNSPRWGDAAAVYDDQAYVFGGSYQGYASSALEVYDFSSDSWETKQNLPDNVFNQGLEAVTVGSLIYLFYDSSTYSYNPQTDEYTQLANAPFNKDWAECAYVNVDGEDRIYLLGGYDLSVGDATNNCAYYRPAFDDWITIGPAPYGAYGTLRDNPVINGTIFYGYGQGQHDSAFYDYMYSFNPSTETWTQLPSGVYPRDGVGCAVVGNKLYVIGGRNTWNDPIMGLDYNEEFDTGLFSQPSLIVNPPIIRMYVNQSQIFTATTFGGTEPYTYSWYLNGSIIQGQNGQTFTFTPTAPGNYSLFASVFDANEQTAQSNTVNDFIVYNQFQPNLMVPDWYNVNKDFFTLVPGAIEPVLTAANVIDRDADFVADPFIYHENGLWYMFFEVHWAGMDYSEIGLAISNDGFDWSYRQIVLSEPFSLAYPYIFKWNGSYYLIPETYSQSEVRLYKATNFPYDWTYVSNILSNQSYHPVDSSVFRYNNKWWMFTSSESDFGYLYYSNNLEDPSAWYMHPMSPINTDWMKVRGAGRAVVFDNGTVIRLTQELYGQGVRAFQVDTLTTTDYAEHEVEGSPLVEATFASGWNAQAMHTVNPWWTGNGWVAAVDAAGYDWLWSIGIYMTPLQPYIAPASTRIGLGQSQNFESIAGGGRPPYTYQWYLNDKIVSGATSQNWVFTPNATGYYEVYVNVIDANGQAQSNIAEISVYESNFDFSIMQITDTQILSAAYPDLYDQLTTWIVNSNATYNVKMVVHTGDIVDQYWAGTQWQNANDAMSVLVNNGIPYTWCAGNHDQIGYSDPNSGWFGDEYSAFNPETFSGESYWVGDYNQGKNTAVKFSVNGYNFLVIDLENQANSATMAWATNLLNIYSNLNYNIIVATHSYLVSPDLSFNNGEPDSPEWENNLQNLLNQYPNVFMTLNGHTHPVPYVSVHNQVNNRTQIQFDRQEEDNYKGACSARIYTFNLTTHTVDVSTYNVWNSTWLINSGDDFSFSPNLISHPTVSITPTVSRMDLGQSQIFNSSVSQGRPPYAYQWYVNGTAVSGARLANFTFTPTQIGHYNIYLNVTDSLTSQSKSNVVSDIIVYIQPSVSVSPASTNIPIGGSQQFNSTLSGGVAPYSYQWYYANGTAISGATTSTLIYKTNLTGTYSIYLNVTDSLNFKSQSNTAIINVYSQPGVTINPTSVNMKVGSIQPFNSTLTGGLIPYTFQWYYSNGTIIIGATNPNISYKANSTGTYNIYLNVTDSLNSKTQSNTATINVYSQPSVTINPNSVNITVGNTQQFNSNVTGGLAPYTYQWYYSNGTAVSSATSSTLLFKANSTGIYTIYLNATDTLNSKTQSNTAAIYVYSQPSVFINPTSVKITVGTLQQFNSTAIGGLIPYAYQWYLNDTAITGATSSVWNFTPTVAGHYKVYLNVTDALNFKIQSNIVTDITVYSEPTVSINPISVKMVVGNTQTFNSTILGGAQPFTYHWVLNGTAVPGANNSTWNFTPIQTGHYSVYLNMTDSLNNQAQSNVVTDILVYLQLTVSINPTSANIVLGGSQQFNSTVEGGVPPYTYQWVLNGTAVPGATNSIWNFKPTQTGHFNIYLNITDAINNQVQSNFVTDILVYSQSALTLNLLSGGSGYTTPAIIITGGGGSGATATPRVSNGVIFDIVLTNPGSGYTSAPTIIIKDPSPRAHGASAIAVILGFSTATISPTKVEMYLGQSQTFNSTVTGGTPPNSYQWYLNDTAILEGNTQNWTFTPAAPGHYKVYVNITDVNFFQIQSNIVTDITVYPLLTVTINPATLNMTVGTPQTFNSAVSGGAQPYTYQWYLNGSQILNANSSTYIFATDSPGTYIIYLKVADNNTAVSQSNNATIAVETLKTVTISPTQVKIYIGQTQTFNSTITGGNPPYFYQWYLNDTAVSGGTNVNWTFAPIAAGNYRVYLNVTDAFNLETQSNIVTDITVYSQPTVSISPVANVTVGIQQTFNSVVSGGAQPYTYQWYLNGNQVLNANSSTYNFTATSPGNYTIYVTVADNNTVFAKSNNVTIVAETPVSINIAPTQAKIYLGQSQTFNSTVLGGTLPYSYQWYLNDTAVTGGTTQNWTFIPTTAGHYKIYLNITDALNIETQSNIVTDITVYSQLNASIGSTFVNMTVGMQQTFNSTVLGGSQPYTYQWYLNGSQIQNATASTYIFTASLPGTYIIYVKVADNYTAVAQSNNATIAVETSKTVMINPIHVKIYVGQAQAFNSSITGGNAPYFYQWYLNDTAVSNGTNANWTFTPIAPGNYKVYLNVTDAFNIETQSNIVTDITIYPQLSVSINPTFINMTAGMQQTFNSSVSGGAQPYTYQWYLNGSPVPNATSNTLTFTPTTTGNFTLYLTVTDNNTQSLQSNNATIRVGSTATITGFDVQSGGSGYTTPVVIITGGGGTGATAVARVSQGLIIGIVLTNPGSGYTSTPIVTFRDPNPRAHGATATATITIS